jgi:hypothetical protein
METLLPISVETSRGIVNTRAPGLRQDARMADIRAFCGSSLGLVHFQCVYLVVLKTQTMTFRS